MWHFAKNFALLLFSQLFLPIDTTIVVAAYVWTKIIGNRFCGNRNGESRHVEAPVTVLITGISMTKGLSIARLFHKRGHRVIGAEWHSLSIGRVSRAVDTFYQLPHPIDRGHNGVSADYLDVFLDIIQKEGVDICISVSDVATAAEDAAVKETVEAKTGIKCIQSNVEDTTMLHEKDSFMEHTKQIGLNVPITKVVRGREEIITFLHEHGGLSLKSGAKQYLIKPLGIEDIVRFDKPLLPLASEGATMARLNTISFASSKPYIMQEFISGDEFCTHSLVIRGQVRAFVACPSADVLMHYTALPPTLPLSEAMLNFTVKQAHKLGPNFTGHLSFDFIVEEGRATKKVFDPGPIKLYPIECNPRVHTATILFNDTPELVDEYLSVLSVTSSASSVPKSPLTPSTPSRYYWIAQDLVELVLYPLYLGITRRITLIELRDSLEMFFHYFTYWKDGIFSIWDPWPFWWMCHVVCPLHFARYLVSGRWNKINISTGKVFEAECK